MTLADGYRFRFEPRPDDVAALRALVAGTGFFNDDEVRIAAELVDERLRRGPASGYEFVLLDDDRGRVAAYACWGPIDGTARSFDLYWIAVRDDLRGAGLGSAVDEVTAARIAAIGGGRVYAETSGRPGYEPTRAFYRRRGYHCEAELADFYGPGDAKLFFVKVVPPAPAAPGA